MATMVGTTCPKTSWITGRMQSQGTAAPPSVSQAPPWLLQARKSKLCPEAPQKKGRLGPDQTAQAGLKSTRGGGQMACWFMEGLINENSQT